jgi:hypothetical protein
LLNIKNRDLYVVVRERRVGWKLSRKKSEGIG